MTTQQDVSIGLKKETTFGTPVVVDSFVEFLTEDFAWTPEFTEGAAMRYGKRVQSASRRVLMKESTAGTLELEATTKGLGKLFEAALGTGTSTQRAATPVYQQLFTPAVSDFLPSYTIQKGIPLVGGGAAQPQTFNGMVCSGFELSADSSGTVTLRFPFVGRGVDTSTVWATPSYPTNYEPFTLVGATIKAGTGAVVVPTTTALATGGTVVANVVSVEMTYDNALDDAGWFIGGTGKRGRKPALGVRSLSGTLTAEYDSNTFRDAFIAQTNFSLVLEFQHPSIIDGTTAPTLQITIPVIRLDGELPKAVASGVVQQSIGFTMLDGLVASHPIYVAVVTAETTI